MTRRITPNGQRTRPPAHDPARLSTGWRAAMAVISFAMVAAGATAVFRTTVEAGPTALITIGAALFVVAAGGRAVTWFKFGDTEVHTDDGRRKVEEDLEEAPPEEALASVQTAAAYDPAILSDPGIAQASAAIYEGLVESALRRVAAVPVAQLNGPFDLEISGEGKRIAVEALFTRRAPGRNRVRELAAAMNNRDYGFDALIVVTATTPNTIVKPELIDEFRRITSKELDIVHWTSPEDDDALRIAFQRLTGA